MGGIFQNEVCEAAIIKVAKGDMSALEVIYNQVGKLLFSVALSLLGNREEAEDALQDTFIKIASSAGRYKKGKQNGAKAWLVTVCRNLCLDKLRNQKQQEKARPVFQTACESESVDSDLAFLQIINFLDVEEKQIVVFKIVWGLKHSQIATVMGITPENCRQKYKRAIHKLREREKANEKSLD